MARYYAFRGEYQKALEQAKQTLTLQVDPVPLHLTMYQIYKELGQEDSSFQYFLQWRSAFGEEVEVMEANYREFGWQRAAEKMLILLEEKSESNYIDPLHLALYAVHAEDFDKAMDYLEQAYDQKVPLLTSIGLETHWKPLFSNQRFKRLLSKMELSPAWAKFGGFY